MYEITYDVLLTTHSYNNNRNENLLCELVCVYFIFVLDLSDPICMYEVVRLLVGKCHVLTSPTIFRLSMCLSVYMVTSANIISFPIWHRYSMCLAVSNVIHRHESQQLQPLVSSSTPTVRIIYVKHCRSFYFHIVISHIIPV